MIRSAIVASCLIAMSSVAANAQDSKLELYGDAEMSNCSVTLSAPGVIQVHIFQTGNAAMASEFALVPPACLAGATWLGDIIDPAFLTIGDTQRDEGLAVAFGGCVATPIHIGYANFLVTDIGSECCEFAVSDPLASYVGINTVNCDEPEVIDPMATQSLTVNPNPGCLCNVPLAVESTTWGKVKSLYR